MPAAGEPVVRVAREAMATRWEAVLHGGDPARLRAAAEEALDEVARAEEWLSPFRPGSAMARVNASAGHGWTPADPRLAAFLARALALARRTGGAFDPTVGPLVRAWAAARDAGTVPDPAVLDAARACTGWHLVELDAAAGAVRFARPGVRVDPGAAGKGLALDLAMEALREAGVDNALVHGGTSSVAAIGTAPGGGPWNVALPAPPSSLGWTWPAGAEAVVGIRDATLSVSAVWGRWHASGGRVLGHVVDPATGEPATRALLAAVECASAFDGDAWSTALLVRGPGPGGAVPDVACRAWCVDAAFKFHVSTRGEPGIKGA